MIRPKPTGFVHCERCGVLFLGCRGSRFIHMCRGPVYTDGDTIISRPMPEQRMEHEVSFASNVSVQPE
jgi:hypothetical protein